MRAIWTTRCAACGMHATMPATSEETGFGGCCFKCQADVRWERGHDGARGSRARYRRAVEARVAEWSGPVGPLHRLGDEWVIILRDALGRLHHASIGDAYRRRQRAVRRARAILEGLR